MMYSLFVRNADKKVFIPNMLLKVKITQKCSLDISSFDVLMD